MNIHDDHSTSNPNNSSNLLDKTKDTNPDAIRGKISTFGLIALAVISVDNIRNLPINAQYGLPCLFYYAIGGLFFFFPLNQIAKEQSVYFKNTGGSYIWIREAFGEKWGFFSVWILWVSTMIWYPTGFSFIATIIGTLIDESLKTNSLFIAGVSLFLFWVMTLLSVRGVEATTVVSVICSIGGTLLPMTLIIILAIVWLANGNKSGVELSWGALIPSSLDTTTLGYFSSILFSLLGIEIVATHRRDVANPKKSYPIALSVAAILIIISLTFSSVSLCIIVSPDKISILSGLIDVFAAFFDAYDMHWCVYFLAVSMILGTIGVASSWIIGLSRCLHSTLRDANVFPWLQVKNKYDIPYRVLLIQGICYTILCSVVVLSPTINSAYWLLSALTSQFNLLYYIFLFAAVIVLRKGRKGKYEFWDLVAPVVAMITCALGIVVAYFPTNSIKNVLLFEIEIISGQIIFLLPVLWIFLRKYDNNNTVK